MSGETPEHEHWLITFVQRYARAFHQDPASVDDRSEADLPLMHLYYESAAADTTTKEGE